MKKGIIQLFSAGTEISYKINEKFYGNTHYVWCAESFHSSSQPPTSDPATICRRYLEQIKGNDRHAHEIDTNKAGILRGAEAKLKSQVIDIDTYNIIKGIVAASDYDAFYPVIYIIDVSKVKSKCFEVPIEDRASDASQEYKIEELVNSEYTIIHTKDFLNTVIEAS